MKQLIGILLFIPFLISCGNFDKISIGQPESIDVQGFEGNYLKLNAKLPITNPTVHRIKIEQIDLKVFLSGRYIGKLLVDENVIIKPGGMHMYNLPVKIRMVNILNTAFIMMTVKKGQQVSVKFEGQVIAKSMLIRKTIPVNVERNVTF